MKNLEDVQSNSVPITRRHYEKYRKLCEKYSVDIRCEKVHGLTREQHLNLIKDDPHLNYIKLDRWDDMGRMYVGLAHNLNVDGEEDTTRRKISMAESVCMMKHAVKFLWIGMTPMFKCEDDT